jgi:hypothetical protein
MSDTVRVILASGLRDQKLQSEVRALLLDDADAPTIARFIKKQTLAQTPEGGKRNNGAPANHLKKNGRNRNGNGVSAVDDADAEDDIDDCNTDELPVDKVTAKNNGQRQRGKRNGKQTSAQNANSGGNNSNRNADRKNNDRQGRQMQCDYCKKPGHTVSRCFVKRFIDENGGPGRAVNNINGGYDSGSISQHYTNSAIAQPGHQIYTVPIPPAPQPGSNTIDIPLTIQRSGNAAGLW